MDFAKLKKRWTRFFSDYGMLLILAALCVFFSFITLNKQHPSGPEAAREIFRKISTNCTKNNAILILAGSGDQAFIFKETLSTRLDKAGYPNVHVLAGSPSDLRTGLDELAENKVQLDVAVATQEIASLPFVRELNSRYAEFAETQLISPQNYMWPDFLKKSNLMAVADRIIVIAIIAVGMTMVIITGGIDLSVGSLIALSAVVSTYLIREFAGAENASSVGMVLCCLAAILACGLIGVFSGLMVTHFLIPPFIVTLAMMMVASGLAFILAQGQSIYQVPNSLIWLGRGSDLGIPNTIVLMLIIYAAAYVLMTRMALGRYIYAVGGNQEAARLSGVPVKSILVFVYAVCGALAGLGGIVQVSQLKSGAPTYGLMYELYVIAAVVVGGTSLSGGEGKILGTLIGAFIIAVIQNGMNLTGVESYTQKVVLGLVILAAVLLDMLKKRGWKFKAKAR